MKNRNDSSNHLASGPTVSAASPSNAPDLDFEVSLSDGTVTQGKGDAEGKTGLLQRDAMHLAEIKIYSDDECATGAAGGAQSKGLYKRIRYVIGQEKAVLHPNRVADKKVFIRRRLPGNIIVVHGVNDVGTSYKAVEEGLCQGLSARLHRGFTPGSYSNPSSADKDKVVDDPDAVYFKRIVSKGTDSPVIPFYWGYRELGAKAKTAHGQKTDRYGNRLDKDLSKGGGPFANATSSLPDMWNQGACAPMDLVGDPLRPLVSAPGRMYMVLAAKRLAALISMIRDYDAGETVTIVAHSQGCMLSLLAQAMLMEQGLRPADTLILTHPPYSLEEEATFLMKGVEALHAGTDEAMAPHYSAIAGRQTLHARLQTLVNIVRGVEAKKDCANPAFATLGDNNLHRGMVEKPWRAEADRDNRGKVYLYFCPEDMTVALDNIRGIGWQGVPDLFAGTEYTLEQDTVYDRVAGRHKPTGSSSYRPHTVVKQVLQELGPGFRQRVFTAKPRLDPSTGKTGPVLVGQGQHDFPLRVKGEDDHAHVEVSGRDFRASHPVAQWPIDRKNKLEEQRHGIRTINGEALRRPVPAELRGNQIDADKIPVEARQARLKPADKGPCEEVDPIDATIAVAGGALLRWSEECLDPSGTLHYPGQPQELSPSELKKIAAAYNERRQPGVKDENAKRSVLRAVRQPDGTIIATIEESPNEGRKRWQHALSAKSFHGAIFGCVENHSHVTAYDVAIGGGMAVTDPNFYDYLCAVADWRLKKPPKKDSPRPGILLWEDFLVLHKVYWKDERPWRKALIEGNVDYYSNGVLPAGLPVLTGKLWNIVVSETIDGKRVNAPKEKS